MNDFLWTIFVATTLVSLPLALYYVGSVIQIKINALKRQSESETSDPVKQQMGYLMAENEELREELKSIKSLLNQERQRIDLDYEKEQMRIDYNAKGSLSV